MISLNEIMTLGETNDHDQIITQICSWIIGNLIWNKGKLKDEVFSHLYSSTHHKVWTMALKSLYFYYKQIVIVSSKKGRKLVFQAVSFLLFWSHQHSSELTQQLRLTSLK